MAKELTAIRLEPETLEKLKKRAKKEGRTLSGLIQFLLDKAVTKGKNEVET